MADVQLERGHVQIANRLHEAIIAARFSERQLQILMVLFRFTYGWRRRSVLLTELELAQQVTDTKAKRASGAFRAELADLLTNGVILRADAPEAGRRGQMIWAINKDFERWGRFSTAESKLAAVFGSKPRWSREHERALFDRSNDMAQDQATDTDERDEQGDEHAQDMWPIKRPYNEEAQQSDVARKRSSCGLIMGQKDEAKSLNGETYASPKDMKDSITPLKQRTPLAEASYAREPEPLPPAAAGPAAATAAANATANRLSEPHRDMLVRLSTAVYHAVCARWGEPTRPIPFGTGSQLAADLIAGGVAWSTVEPAIKRVCEKKSGGAPTSLEYFRAAIFEAHEAAAEKAIIANAQHRPAGGAQAVAALLGRETPGDRDRKAEEALRDEYDHARREAAEAWATDPANAGAVRIISAKAQLELGASVYGNYGEAALASAIRLRCADRAGFPDFESWKNSRERGENPESVPKQGVTLSAAE